MRAGQHRGGPTERAAARVRAAGLKGDPVAVDHAARAFVTAVHLAMLRRLMRGARRLIHGAHAMHGARR